MNATNNSLSSSKDACFHWHVIINDEYVVSDYFYTVLAIVINLLTCPFIILLNGLVIVAIKTKRRLQTPHNILLACLAATDLVVGIGAQPVFITEEIYVLVAGTSSLACSFYNLTQLVINYFYTVLAIVINLLTCPFIILLNGLVIVAIKTKRRLQTPHNILLACLAATDLVVGIGAQPVFIAEEIYVLVAGTSSLACFVL
ncbi:hypothetical protein OS493_039274 [Desmophyllum pertusum]|uniref:G-protein coupled receptors family 1 profile domain-containing protein n=1 Tax=Desmophyllum pertusum TaxID=174260 RepID=A0A9W9Z6A1_9CNID|nr:hypothetical protein OS493_039274 [Desmophyllum pertusum]